MMGSSGRLDNEWADIKTGGGPGFLGSKIDTVNIATTSQAQQQEDLQCLRELNASDPAVDRLRIIAQKDELSESLCAWIFDDPEFLRWRDTDNIRLLWIHSEPGKGKTMAMMALLDHISKQTTDRQALGSFFCQNDEPHQNNAGSVLRGLIFQLASSNQKLLKILKQKHAAAKGQIFDGPGALFDLLDVLAKMLRCEDLTRVYLLIDALDECSYGQEDLLQVITRADLASSSKVKWLVTSRNEFPIERYLQHARFGGHISLESNAARIAQSVSRFIHDKVQKLASAGRYPQDVQNKIRRSLEERAEGTFLWVWLVCKELEKLPSRRALMTVEKYPPGLNAVYRRMVETIRTNEREEEAEFCLKILRALAVAPRPLLLPELRFVADLPEEEFPYDEAVADQVRICSSFLSIRSGRVSFVHQSARDFVCSQENNPVLDRSLSLTNSAIAGRCFARMNKDLKLNICDLPHPGTSNAMIDEATKQQSLSCDFRYVCLNWMHHFEASGGVKYAFNLQQDPLLASNVDTFVNVHLLHWLEVLSILNEIPVCLKAIEALNTSGSELHINMASDLKRFVFKYRHGIETSALQIYYSAVTFAPLDSLLRKQYTAGIPKLIDFVEALEPTWGNNLLAVESQGRNTSAVTFSSDGQLFACGSSDQTVKIWDIQTGSLRNLFSGHKQAVTCVAFSFDSTKIVSGSLDRTIRLWDIPSSHAITICKIPETSVCNLALNRISTLILATFYDGSFRSFNASTGEQCAILEMDRGVIPHMCMSPDQTLVTVRGFYGPLKIWDTRLGELVQKIEDYTPGMTCLGFSSDNTRLATASSIETLNIWDLQTGQRLQKQILQIASGASSVGLSPDLRFVAYGTENLSIRLIEIGQTGGRKSGRKFQGHSAPAHAVVFSPDGTMLASSANDGIIMIWDIKADLLASMQMPSSDGLVHKAVCVSPNEEYLFCLVGTEIAPTSGFTLDRTWDNKFITKRLRNNESWMVPIESGSCQMAFESLAIFPNSQRIAVGLRNTLQVWSVENSTIELNIKLDDIRPEQRGFETETYQGQAEPPYVWPYCIAVSPDGTTLVSCWSPRNDSKGHRATGFVLFSDSTSGSTLYTFESLPDDIPTLAFNPKEPATLAIHHGSSIQIWDTHKKTIVAMKEVPYKSHKIAWSSNGKYFAALILPKTVHVWSVNDLKPRKLLKGSPDLFVHFPGSSWHTIDEDGEHPRIALDDSYTMITIGGRETIWLPPSFRPGPGSRRQDLWAATKKELFIVNWQGSLLQIQLDLTDWRNLKQGSEKLQQAGTVAISLSDPDPISPDSRPYEGLSQKRPLSLEGSFQRVRKKGALQIP